MSEKRQAKGIKWPWLIISPKEYRCWQSTGKGSYKREQNSLKHTNKSNLLKLICIRGSGPLSKNTDVESSNPVEPYAVYQEKSHSAGNALARGSRKIESEIRLLGQRTSNDNEGMPWKTGRAEKPNLQCTRASLGHVVLYSWAAKHFSAAFCKSQMHHLLIVSNFQGREVEGHSRSGKQGMSSRFSDELSFWMKQWLPDAQSVTCFVAYITISLRSGWVRTLHNSPKQPQGCPPVPAESQNPRII